MSAGSGTRILGGASTRAELDSHATITRPNDLSASAHPAFWTLIALLSLVGCVGVWQQVQTVYGIWVTDPLRSIGVCILATSLFLVLRAWRDQGWELLGTWWGLLPISLSFVPLMTSHGVAFFWATSDLRINFIPSVFPIYLYASGVVLLFAGIRVWRAAWFPLLLLLCIQPVPEVFVRLLDLPMQQVAARVARSFAYALGLAPSDSELLRLMFTPSFGMFIAPGCDGMRGAVTLGYGALILGYLKRMPFLKWGVCVVGAVVMAHIFNLLRLCGLVLYYKWAIGSPFLEGRAKLADYVIGGLLFLMAALLFLWITLRDRGERYRTFASDVCSEGVKSKRRSQIYWKAGAFCLLVLIIIEPGVQAARRDHPANLSLDIRRGNIAVEDLRHRIPAQVGTYRQVRAWHEEIAGTPALEIAAFDSAASNEIEIGIWLGSSDHSIRASLMTHGETPRISRTIKFATAGGQVVPFNTALYDDGITTTVIGDTHCSPSACYASLDGAVGVHFALTNAIVHTIGGQRSIPIFFKIQTPHADRTDEATYEESLGKSKEFLSTFDFLQVSREFQ